jgi:hypothetical protein
MDDFGKGIGWSVIVIFLVTLAGCSQNNENDDGQDADSGISDSDSVDDCQKEAIIYQTSDFAPDTGWDPGARPLDESEEDPGALRLLIATSTDGISWTPTGEAFIDQVGAPEVVKDTDGRLFVYYMSGTDGLEDVWVAAVSEDDGETWVHKHVTVNGVPTGGRIADTTTHILSDGTFRSYFQSEFPGDGRNKIRSALSCDGLNFTIEDGIRVDGINNSGMAVAPSILVIGDEVHMYAIDPQVGSEGNKNAHFVSSDGLDFTEQARPEVDMILANAAWVNGEATYYGFHVAPGDDAFHSSLYFSKTTDGMTFDEEQLFMAVDTGSDSLDYFMLKEPAVIQRSDGDYMLFYLSGFREDTHEYQD